MGLNLPVDDAEKARILKALSRMEHESKDFIVVLDWLKKAHTDEVSAMVRQPEHPFLEWSQGTAQTLDDFLGYVQDAAEILKEIESNAAIEGDQQIAGPS